MPDPLIPFNRSLFVEQGLSYVRDAFKNLHVSGDGDFTFRCQRFFEQNLGAPKVLLTTSCTDALELSALLLKLAPGDEVIVPAFTFVSTANAFALRGAKPVFVDVRPDTFNIDETKIAAAITSRTKALVIVHYAGVGCEMETISRIAQRHGLPIVEDNAHGLFGTYDGQPLGSFGQFATLSFHETKNLSCGEGGALVLNDIVDFKRAEILREKGTDRSQFFRGEIDKYSWRDIGSSFLPSDILAAMLWAQIEIHTTIQERRRAIYTRYGDELQTWAGARGVQLPIVPVRCTPSYHLFSLLLPTAEAQRACLEFLRQQRINAVFHYQALHLTPMGRSCGGREGECPVAEAVSDRLIRLPFFFDLTTAEQDRVIAAVTAFTP